VTLDDIVSLYIANRRESLAREMDYFATQESLGDVVREGTLCRVPDGKGGHKKHRHQWRIPNTALEEAERRLQDWKERLGVAVDFNELHTLIEGEIRDIRKVGPLAWYDIAHRIGAFLGKAPARVYLHRGTKEGAAALNLKGVALDPWEFPEAFSKLNASEIEDCLCIYKNPIKFVARFKKQLRLAG
jgi:hypothetical protein